MSGKDGSCCLGTYTCVATNCMGSVTSSAALLGFEARVFKINELSFMDKHNRLCIFTHGQSSDVVMISIP